MGRHAICCWCLLATATAYAQWPEQEPRSPDTSLPPFRAARTTGERTIERLAGWEKAAPSLELASGPLDSRDRSVRWLRSTRTRPKPADASGVHFLGGDFLPGVVVGQAASNIGEPMLLVEPAVAVMPSDVAPRQTVEVSAAWIKRIVWQPRGRDDFQPHSAFLRSGRSVRFRGLRWTEGAVRLLAEEKVELVPLADLAELHLADQDPWTTYLRLLADLSPDCRAKVVQIESAAGLRVTSSSQRLRPWLAGNQPAAQHAVCVVQPPWAGDGVCIPLADLQQLMFFDPEEIPLTRFEPARDEHRGFALAGSAPWRRNTSAVGTPLFSGGRDYAWGFGVQAQEQLDFALPAAATRVQTWVGMDASAGRGGAARGRMEALAGQESGGSTAVSADSAPLVGSQRPAQQLEIRLPERPERNATVRLVADALIRDRPPQSDPLDICDFVDWLQPLVILDRQQLAAQVRSHWHSSMAALEAWSLDGDWQPRTQWRPGGRPQPGFRREIELSGEALRMSQKLLIAAERSRLVVHATRLAGKSAAIEMRLIVAGQQQAVRSIPIDAQLGDDVALVADLSAYAGRSAPIELEFRSRGQEASFEIRSIVLEPPPASDRP
jgi:NPCBM/NEW2 domain-containing protein